MERNKAKVALDSLNKVKQYNKCGNYGRAFAHYLVFLELSLSERSHHERKFARVLSNWCMELEERNQYEDVYKCYLKGLHYFPLSINILNNFGTQLLRLGQEHQAKKYLQLAHNVHQEYLPVEKNLATVFETLVPRWHFRMLNNVKRNEPYLKAITSTIDSHYNKILDIGTGCGLLSLFASENKHVKIIHAIEESKTLSDIAKEVFKKNNINNVNLITENSTKLDSYKVVKSNVLITEIFDTALFGEHVLETLIHAHKHLLEKDFKIIPASANVYITGIECEKINKKHRFINYDLDGLKFGNVCVRGDLSEPYEAEHITNFNHKLITETKKFVSVNFSDLKQLENIFKNVNAIPELQLECVETGSVHAFVIWFDLILSEEKITTNPFDPENSNCWEQAIVYINHPIEVRKGENVNVQISCLEDKLEIEILEPKAKTTCDCFEINLQAVTFLNDRKLVRILEKSTANFNNPQNLVILDLNPVPIFGLIMAKKDAQIFTTAIEPEFLTKICEINEINIDNITVIEADELFKYLESNQLFDVIVYNPIMQSGIINEHFYSNFGLIEASLKKNGVFIPENVELHARIVESDYLNYTNKVDDKNLFNYKISEFINAYMICEQWNLDDSFKPTKYLSNETLSGHKLFVNDSSPKISKYKIKCCNSGVVNGILYWYSINYSDGISYSTLDSDYYNRASFVNKVDMEIEVEDNLEVCVKQHAGLLKITCDKMILQ